MKKLTISILTALLCGCSSLPIAVQAQPAPDPLPRMTKLVNGVRVELSDAEKRTKLAERRAWEDNKEARELARTEARKDQEMDRPAVRAIVRYLAAKERRTEVEVRADIRLGS